LRRRNRRLSAQETVKAEAESDLKTEREKLNKLEREKGELQEELDTLALGRHSERLPFTEKSNGKPAKGADVPADLQAAFKAARPEAHRRRNRRRHARTGHRPRLPELPRVGPGVLSPRVGRADDLRGVMAEAAAGVGAGSIEGEAMPVISFRVDGLPKGQPRPRAFARKMGDRFVARVFDAGTAEAWKSEIALAARPSLPPAPLAVPIEMRVEFISRGRNDSAGGAIRRVGFPQSASPMWTAARGSAASALSRRRSCTSRISC
jgi:hypothetical protein